MTDFTRIDRLTSDGLTETSYTFTLDNLIICLCAFERRTRASRRSRWTSSATWARLYPHRNSTPRPHIPLDVEAEMLDKVRNEIRMEDTAC